MSQRFPKLIVYLVLLLLGGVLLSPLITSATLTLDSTSLSSDTSLTLKSASSSITLIGETNQTGAITVASSSETLTLNLGTGTGATTVNIATGATNAKTVNIATAASLIHTLTIGTPSSTTTLQGRTVTIASSTDALTLNLGANTGRHTVNIATGQTSSTVNIGSSSSTIVLNNFWTALPTSPVDGQEIVYAASSTAGVYWHLKYNSSAAKWAKIGGPPLYALVTTSETTTNTGFVNLTTVGPYLTAPLAGTYLISVGADTSNGTVGNRNNMAPKIGAAATDANDGWTYAAATATTQVTLMTKRSKTVAAGDLILAQYRSVDGGTATFFNRWLEIDPVFVQ